MEVDRILADAFLAGHPAEAAREIECHPLPAAAASVVLRRVNADLRGLILERMQPGPAARIRMRLQYPAGTAGALLDPAVLTAPPDLTVADALQRLGRADLRAHSYLFVVDADGVLAGVIGLGELLNAARDARVGAIARREFEVMHASAGRDAILTHPAWRDLQTPPVVDASGHVLGVMRYAMVRTLAAESSQPLGTTVAAAVLEFGELAWEAGSDVAGELAGASAAHAGAGKEPAGN